MPPCSKREGTSADLRQPCSAQSVANCRNSCTTSPAYLVGAVGHKCANAQQGRQAQQPSQVVEVEHAWDLSETYACVRQRVDYIVACEFVRNCNIKQGCIVYLEFVTSSSTSFKTL